MNAKRKNFGIIKSTAIILIIILLFFTSIEVVQRIRYFLRFNSTYWLFYGFVKLPDNYNKLLERGIKGERALVEIPVITFKRGSDIYRKYNPKFDTYGKINSYGFRGKEFSSAKKNGVIRIVALGGSTTFGLGVNDGFTYPDFLENFLNVDNTGKQYEIINAGISGAEIKDISNLFKYEIIRLNPDTVIISNVINNLYFSDIAYKSSNFSLQKINQVLLNKSILYMTLREKIECLFHRKIDDIYKATSTQMLNNFLNDDNFWKKLDNNYRNIIDLAKLHNIRVIIVKEPLKLGDYEQRDQGILLNKKFEPVYKKIFSLFDSIAIEKNIIIVDAYDYFNTSSQKNLFSSDGVHLTLEGNKCLANLIATKIKEVYKN